MGLATSIGSSDAKQRMARPRAAVRYPSGDLVIWDLHPGGGGAQGPLVRLQRGLLAHGGPGVADPVPTRACYAVAGHGKEDRHRPAGLYLGVAAGAGWSDHDRLRAGGLTVAFPSDVRRVEALRGCVRIDPPTE